MLMSQTTTHGILTPAQTQQFGSQLGNQSFWAGMLNGGIDFNTTYANTTYSDDVGTHDILSAYNVNIFGGAAMIGPQNPAGFNPQGTFDDAYKGCVGSLGKSMAPGLTQADRILDVANKTGVDPTLLAVTWRFESSFSFQPTNGMHTPNTQTGDIGPGQLFPDIWDKSPYTDDVNHRKLNPFGTNRNVGQMFNGNAYDNLIVAGRALGTAQGAGRADAAGIFRAGASGNPGYKERVQNFKDNVKNYDAFFGCLAKKGFSP